VIIATVVLQSFTAKPMTRLLGLADPEPNGVLIVGANRVARAIAQVLVKQGFRVKLADTSWQDIRKARMEGLETYYGDPLSSHASAFLELVGIGRLFAMSRSADGNTLACLKYRSTFGNNRVFSLRNAEERDNSDREKREDEFHATRMFGDDISYQKLASLISQGADIKVTNLSESFSLEDARAQKDGKMIPLFIITVDGKLRLFTNQDQPKLENGSRLIALVWGQSSEADSA